jgi:hypothetical protein
VTTKSKDLAGLRSYFQYSLNPKVQLFNGLAVIYRRDTDAFARSTECSTGATPLGKPPSAWCGIFVKCALRLQVAYTNNASNIDIYDFNRTEVSSVIRCEMN